MRCQMGDVSLLLPARGVMFLFSKSYHTCFLFFPHLAEWFSYGKQEFPYWVYYRCLNAIHFPPIPLNGRVDRLGCQWIDG